MIGILDNSMMINWGFNEIMRIQDIYYVLFTRTLDNMLEDTEFTASLA